MDAPESKPQPNPRRQLAYRSRHRAKQDDLAHANGGAPPELVIPDDPLIPRGEPELVTTAAGLEELIAHLREVAAFAYDSEFIGEESYVPRICLIQVAAADRVALVDPLGELDLRPFWSLLADPAVEKIVHAGLQDLEPVWRFLGRPPANIFDTQIAAGFAGRPYPIALWKLVQEFVGVELGKSPKFSQWDRRPLTPVQLAYAANDVRFLPSLRAKLGARLESIGNAPWAAQECEALTDPALYTFDVQVQLQRLRGTDRLSRRELAILEALLVWRDQAARESDMPPRTFLKDGILLDMSRNPIMARPDLTKVWGLPRPVESAYGEKIVQITQEALALPPESLPKVVRNELTMSEQAKVEEIWALLLERAGQNQIDPAVVGSRSELSKLFHKLVRGKEPGDARLLRGWRRDLLGEAIQTAAAAIIQERAARRRKEKARTPPNAAPPGAEGPATPNDDETENPSQ